MGFLTDEKRTRYNLHHEQDSYIEYMNGSRYSQQWLHDVDHKRDWYDPHWQEQYKTEINKQVYRFTGKEPWYEWKSWLIMGLIFPNRWTIGIAVTGGCIWWLLNKW